MPRRGVYSTTGTKPQVGMYRHGSIQDTAMRSKGGLCGLVSYETSGVFLTPPSLLFFSPDVTFLIVRLPPPLSWKSRPFQSPQNFAHLSPPHNRSPDCINHGSTPSNREEEKDRPCERGRDGWDHKMGGTDDGRRARPSFCDGEHCTTYYVRTEMSC